MLFSCRISRSKTLYLLGTPNHYKPSDALLLNRTLAKIRPDFIFLELDSRRLRIVQQSPFMKSDQLIALNYAKISNIPILAVDSSDAQNAAYYAQIQENSERSWPSLLAKYKIQQFLFKNFASLLTQSQAQQVFKNSSYLRVMLQVRESHMLKQIESQNFKRGVLCCGMSHVRSLQTKMGDRITQIQRWEEE